MDRKDCYDAFLNHMVKYLKEVHDVNIFIGDRNTQKSACRLVQVHDTNGSMKFKVDLPKCTLKIIGNLDAILVPTPCGKVGYVSQMIS
jgi:hypothetical protein